MHVAIISFGYPPIPHVAGTRAYYMAQELVRIGHVVTVLTVDWRIRRDETLGRELAHVVRIDPRGWNPGFSPTAPPFDTEPRDKVSPLRRKLRTLRRTVGWGPYESWAQAAFAALRRHHRARPIDVTWAIHGDDSSHVIAHRFWRSEGVPWVADFKDPWHLFHSRAARRVQRWVTARRLSTAFALTETSAAQGQEDTEFGRPWFLVWSGYDVQMMELAQPEECSSSFALVHVGHMSGQHDVASVAKLLRDFRNQSPGDANLELCFYGHGFAAPVAAARAEGVDSMVSVRGFLPRERAFGVMKGANALLLLPAKPSLGVKELEYMASGSPVLCLGRLADELQPIASRLPQVVQAETMEHAVGFLRDEYLMFKAGRASSRRGSVNDRAVAEQGWAAQAIRLERVLCSAVGRRGAQKPNPTLLNPVR